MDLNDFSFVLSRTHSSKFSSLAALVNLDVKLFMKPSISSFEICASFADFSSIWEIYIFLHPVNFLGGGRVSSLSIGKFQRSVDLLAVFLGSCGGVAVFRPELLAEVGISNVDLNFEFWLVSSETITGAAILMPLLATLIAFSGSRAIDSLAWVTALFSGFWMAGGISTEVFDDCDFVCVGCSASRMATLPSRCMICYHSTNPFLLVCMLTCYVLACNTGNYLHTCQCNRSRHSTSRSSMDYHLQTA